MASKRKKLPVTYPGNSVPEAVPCKNKEWEARERKYKAEEALRTLQRADEVRRDKGLMKDVKALATQQLKAVTNGNK